MNKRETNKERTATKRTKKEIPGEVASMIRTRAYQVYCERGGRQGDALNDWLVAEKQVKRELGL